MQPALYKPNDVDPNKITYLISLKQRLYMPHLFPNYLAVLIKCILRV